MMKVYRTALYERVSREDGDDEASESIRVQKQMLEDYCRDRAELRPVKHYSDDGYTGVKFDRPAFSEMMKDIEEGRIDCVLVKDLSRFGRDLVLVGEYLERTFPRLGVRFIAIQDKVDSERGPYTMMLPIANLLNAQYAVDISQKVRAALAVRRKEGNYLCPSAPYGYDKKPTQPGKLTKNEDSVTVKRIFELYRSGMGKTAIAGLLNREGIPSPGRRRAESGFYQKASPDMKNWTWSVFTVDRLLRDPVYAGDTPVGKTRRKGMHGKAARIPREDREVIRDTHPAVIEREEWERVQAMLAERSRGMTVQGEGGLFGGLVFCGVCGGRMKAVNRHGKKVYYCARYRTGGSAACGSHNVGEEELRRIVLEDVNRFLEHVDVGALCSRRMEELERSCREKEARLTTALSGLAMDKQAAYEKYRSGKLTREAFLEARDRLELSMEETRWRIRDCEKSTGSMQWLDRLAERGRLNELTKADVRAVVDRVVVGVGREVEIYYRLSEMDL